MFTFIGWVIILIGGSLLILKQVARNPEEKTVTSRFGDNIETISGFLPFLIVSKNNPMESLITAARAKQLQITK